MDSTTNQSSNVTKIVIAIVVIILCCACIVIGAAGYIIYQASQNIPIDLPLPPTQQDPSNPPPTPERPPSCFGGKDRALARWTCPLGWLRTLWRHAWNPAGKRP